ncbi:MAG: hypothetical protein OIN89_00100 [Candidatus Methanoperedens sp.]|jgi:predicted transcriptional regulator|nr:hypothetical protein [Candidatus Methanoperedens sp.]
MLTSRVRNELELLKRHIIVLRKVMDSGPIGIMKLSMETKIPDHQVRYSLRVLEQQGLITPTTQGAVASKSAHEAHSGFNTEFGKIREMMTDIEETGSE